MDFRDNRLRTSIHINSDNLSLVVDTGPDFRQQVLRERINHLDAVLYTHQHRDHTAGLDEIRSFNFKQNQDIPIYVRKEVLEQLQQEFAYIFSDNQYPGLPQVKANVIDGSPFKIGTTEITPIETMHYKLPVYGYRILDFAYITDTNFIDESSMNQLKNLEVLVINALQIEKHISHFNLQEALDVIKQLNPKKAYLTHISHKLGSHKKVDADLPENVFLAHDGLQIQL